MKLTLISKRALIFVLLCCLFFTSVSCGQGGYKAPQPTATAVETTDSAAYSFSAKIVKLGGFLLVAGEGLLCSNQTRLLAFRAPQTVFLAKSAAKNADTAAFLPPRSDGGRGFRSF